MKKVLIVSATFPPVNRISAVRAGMFAKYLPEFGWEPIVITGDWGYQESDAILDNDFMPDVIDRVVVKVDARPRWSASRIAAGLVGKGPYFGDFGAFNQLSNFIKEKLWSNRSPIRLFNSIKKKLPAAIEKFKPDAIFSTSPPRACHAAVGEIAHQFAIPWIADFRDIFEQSLNSKLSKWLANSQEKRTLKTAAAVVAVTPHMLDSLKRRSPLNLHLIPNGFCPEDFSDQPSLDEKFTVTYTGSIQGDYLKHRNPKMLFQAFDCLFEKGVAIEDCQVNFLGSIDKAGVMSQIGNCKSKGIANFLGLLPRDDARRRQQSSQLLFQLAHGTQRGVMTGKIFEYLGARRPIISIPSDHDCVDDLLSETKAGFSCDNVAGTTNRLMECYRQWENNGRVDYEGDDQAIGKYNRRVQTEELSAILFGILEKSKAGVDGSGFV